MANKNRVKRLEEKISPKENITYVIDLFPKKGEEVSVSGIGITPYKISMEEFEKIDTTDDMVISVEFVSVTK